MAELITMDWSRVPAGTISDQKYVVEATPPVSAGIQIPDSSLFVVIGVIAEDANPEDLLNLYVPQFGDKVDQDQVIFVRTTPLSATGFLGTPLLTRVEPVIS